MAIENDKLDNARAQVLDRMESGQRQIKLAVGAAAVLELAMLVTCILLVDWSDRTQILMFVIFILSYFIVVLGMLALAGHITRSTARVLAVLDAQQGERH